MKNFILIFKSLFFNKSGDANLFYYRANARDSIGDLNGAISDYTKAIELDPKNAEAFCCRSFALKEFSNAYYYIINSNMDRRMAIQLNSKYEKIDPILRLVRKRRCDFQGAVTYYSTKIEINPLDYELYYFRGYAKEFLGQSQNALEDYNKAIEINPKYAKPYFRRGILRTSCKEKIIEFSKFIELDPNNAKGYYSRGAQKALLLIEQIKDQLKNGQIVILTEDFDDELSDFNNAVKLNPKYDEAFYLRGHVYARMGNRRSAYYDFEKAAELGNSMAKSEIMLNYQDIKRKIDIMDSW